jgi:hypothetical protein
MEATCSNAKNKSESHGMMPSMDQMKKAAK